MELITALEQFLAENVKGVSIDAQTVLAYASRPPNSDGASADGRSQPSAALPPSVQTPPDPPWVLDTEAFQVALDNALKDNVAGYVAQLRQAGQVVFTKTWEYAKRPPQDGRLLWRTDVPMHVASVSKLMTAMAMTVLMGDKISPDDSIIGYLPEYWTKTKNIQLITFRDLFNHTSGLSSSTEPTDFYSMKAAIAGATDGPGNYNYQNVNYGLFRIILAVMNGNIKNNSYFGGGQILTNDQFWDATTISAYNQYLQANVFKPSGVGDATLDQPSACALAYRRPDDINPGWNSGSMFGSCGCDGWHLSVNDLLNVMGEFRRGSGILTSSGAAQMMLDNGFGVDPLSGNLALPAAYGTNAGNLYCKPGDWHDGNTKRDEQTLAYFLPQDMELAVFINSPVAGQIGTNNFRYVVTMAYLNSLVPPQPTRLI